MENNMEVPHKTKNRTTIRSNNFTPGYISEENKNTNSKRYNVHSSVFYNRQEMGLLQMNGLICGAHTHTHTHTQNGILLRRIKFCHLQ